MNAENIRRYAAVASGILTAGLVLAAPAFADPVTMAPPIDSGSASAAPTDSDAGAQDSVFNWSEVPEGQHVTITRAVFDRGGYQLYDDVGETIIVPFANNNLYVMKFAVSDTGGMYFVNDGGAPELYVPQDGYLENATVSGAKWYPFTQDFHPSEPVYIGCAPSWDAYLAMGWYPGMSCWGGYWGNVAFVDGGVFGPTLGFDIFIGGNDFHGWGPYHDYYYYHNAPYHTGWYHQNYYNMASNRSGSFWGSSDAHWNSSSRPTSPYGRWNSAHNGTGWSTQNETRSVGPRQGPSVRSNGNVWHSDNNWGTGNRSTVRSSGNVWHSDNNWGTDSRSTFSSGRQFEGGTNNSGYRGTSNSSFRSFSGGDTRSFSAPRYSSGGFGGSHYSYSSHSFGGGSRGGGGGSFHGSGGGGGHRR